MMSLPVQDWLSPTVSVLALIFSMVAFLQKRSDTYWGSRKEVSEALSHLGSLNFEIETLRNTPDSQQPRFDAIGMLNDQRRFLVRHAAALAKRGMRTMTTHQFLIIAWGFDAIDDFDGATEYFELAIRSKGTALDRFLALRSYAQYLDKERLVESAEKRYDEALASVPPGGDRYSFYRGYLFEKRAFVEHRRGDQEQCRRFVKAAVAEYDDIQEPVRKKRLLEHLQQLPSKGQATPAVQGLFEGRRLTRPEGVGSRPS